MKQRVVDIYRGAWCMLSQGLPVNSKEPSLRLLALASRPRPLKARLRDGQIAAVQCLVLDPSS
jgi:hypothetical protein